MRILVTGASGSIGAALVPRLLSDGHEVVAFARRPGSVRADVPVVLGDAVTGEGLDEALSGADVAFFLVHAMEGEDPRFDERERASAQHFVDAARRTGLRRVVYLGGLVPADRPPSRHLRSRLAVEEALLAGVQEAIALRASIVVGAGSRSFRFLVRLVERVPVLPLPTWREHRTRPIDVRDVVASLAAAATLRHPAPTLSLDLGGPDVLTYAQIVEGIRDHLLLDRPALALPVSATALAAPVAAAITGEDPGLIVPLMESLEGDLLPRDDCAAALLDVRLHGFDRAVEHALGQWEAGEELAAR
jgi:uncharacterized protein YbjT (DUF2867 family)